MPHSINDFVNSRVDQITIVYSYLMGRIQCRMFFEKSIEYRTFTSLRYGRYTERIGSHGSTTMSLPDLITHDHAGFVCCTSDLVPEIYAAMIYQSWPYSS